MITPMLNCSSAPPSVPTAHHQVVIPLKLERVKIVTQPPLNGWIKLYYIIIGRFSRAEIKSRQVEKSLIMISNNQTESPGR